MPEPNQNQTEETATPVTEAELERALQDITTDEVAQALEQVPEGIEGVDFVIERHFHCTECEHNSDYITAIRPMTHTDYGRMYISDIRGMSIEQMSDHNIDWGDSDDYETAGDDRWECRNCGRQLTGQQIQEGIVEERQELIRELVIPGANRIRMPRAPRHIQPLEANEDRFHILAGIQSGQRHIDDALPESFSPEVVSPYVHKNDPYGYALVADCPSCENSFMVGPEDQDIVCPKCNHEFQINAQSRPFDAQNAQERRRRFGAAFS